MIEKRGRYLWLNPQFKIRLTPLTKHCLREELTTLRTQPTNQPTNGVCQSWQFIALTPDGMLVLVVVGNSNPLWIFYLYFQKIKENFIYI